MGNCQKSKRVKFNWEPVLESIPADRKHLFDEYIQSDEGVTYINKLGNSSLMTYCTEANPIKVESIIALAKSTKSIKHTNVVGQDALQCAAVNPSVSRSVVECLIQQGSNVNQLQTKPEGYNALMRYIEDQDPPLREIAEVFVKSGSNPSQANESGLTALHLLVEHESVTHEFVQMFVDAGYDVNKTTTGRGHSCLERYLDFQSDPDTQIVQVLLKAGADLSLIKNKALLSKISQEIEMLKPKQVVQES